MKHKKKQKLASEPLPQLPVSGAIIGYARVSTAEQNLDMQVSALNQMRTLINEATQEYKVGCDRLYSEKVSAVSSRRYELEKALALLREGDTLVVWRLDRLARSLPDLIDRVNYIEKCGAKLRSLNESIDTNTAVGRLLFHVLGSLAQFERDLTKERITSGIKAARERGEQIGAKPMFSVKQRDHMQRQRNNRRTLKQIAAEMKCSAGTVRNWTSPPPSKK